MINRTERFFIVTPGRTGSSLLAAVLAQAGADFAMPVPALWDPSTGVLELRAFQRALASYEKAHRLSGGGARPAAPWAAWQWAALRRHARRHLDDALAQAKYLKAVNADLALQAAVRLGYEPRIILSTRRPEAYVASAAAHSRHVTPDAVLSLYRRTMRNGLAALSMYGGCVTSFDDITDPDAEAWAYALAALTGLEAHRLLAARERVVRIGVADKPAPCLCPEATRLWRESEKLRGDMIDCKGGRVAVARRRVMFDPPERMSMASDTL